MKFKTLILTSFILISFTFNTQVVEKTREASIIFYNFQNYGLMYKTGKTDTKLWRYRLLTGSIGSSQRTFSNEAFNESYSFNFTFAAGREGRKPLNENLNLIYGVELTGGFNFSDSKNYLNGDLKSGGKQNNYSAGLVGVFGMNYVINDKVIIGVELLPSAIYTKTEFKNYTPQNSESSSNSLRFGFNNNSALLSVGIRF